MRRWMAVMLLLWGLGCAGVQQLEAQPPPPAAPAGPGPLVGRWCENDPEVGCYRFEESTVIEEPVRNKRGSSGESRGPFSVEGKMLVMVFPEGAWTLEIVERTDRVLVLHDHSQKDTFTFTRTD